MTQIPTLDDGTDTMQVWWEDGADENPGDPKRPTISIPGKKGDKKQDLGVGNQSWSGTINLSGRVQLNGSDPSSVKALRDKLKEWHRDATELTYTDRYGDTYTVTIRISFAPTNISQNLIRADLTVEEDN